MSPEALAKQREQPCSDLTKAEKVSYGSKYCFETATFCRVRRGAASYLCRSFATKRGIQAG